jgi:7-cyano-7-deazaguanine synthase
MKVVVLCSGGLDSVTALHWARRNHTLVAVLSFDYGAKHNHREIPCAIEHARKIGVSHQIIPLDFIGKYFVSDLLKGGGEIPAGHYAAENMRRTVVPFRNGIMLAAAAGFAESAGAGGLVIAAHSGDHTIYPDCREDFIRGHRIVPTVHHHGQETDCDRGNAAGSGLRAHLVMLQGR